MPISDDYLTGPALENLSGYLEDPFLSLPRTTADQQKSQSTLQETTTPAKHQPLSLDKQIQLEQLKHGNLQLQLEITRAQLELGDGNFYFHSAFPFGLRSATLACQRTTQSVAYILNITGILVDVYIDDFYGACRPSHSHSAFQRINTPNANMADRSVGARNESNESEVSRSSMFCYDIASPEKSCFVVDMVCFISLCF